MSAFNALQIALAKAGVKVTDESTATAKLDTRTCAGTTKNGAPCRNHPITGSDYCRLHQPAAASVLAQLQAAIVAAKAEAKARAKARAKAVRRAKAEALRRAEARRNAVSRREYLLRQVVDLGAAIADAQAEYDRNAAPLAEALNEARRLRDLIPAAFLNAAQTEADTLRETFNTAQTKRSADLRRVQAQIAKIEESAAYRAHLEILNALEAKGAQILARANTALNAKDYGRAEAIAAKALRAVFPENVRGRAEKFVDAVRYQRRNARRRAQGKWFAGAREARQSGDILVAVGEGQFVHLRPAGGSHRRPEKWVVVSALGFDAPAEYAHRPRGRRLSWEKKGRK